MNQMVKFGLVLAIICLTATLVLAVTYQITKPKIEQQLKKEEQEALKVIVPEADSFEQKSIEDTEYYEVIDNGKVTGYCIKTTAQGYNGFIRMVIGIDKEGVIKGVEILEHQETPGLGAKIKEVRPGEKQAWFLRQYVGKPAKEIEVRKNIDAITGATITSRAVTDEIKKTVGKFLSKVNRKN